MQFNLPNRLMSLILFFKGGKYRMTFIFEGFNLILLLLTIKCRSYPNGCWINLEIISSHSFKEFSHILHVVNLCIRVDDYVLDVYSNIFYTSYHETWWSQPLCMFPQLFKDKMDDPIAINPPQSGERFFPTSSSSIKI